MTIFICGDSTAATYAPERAPFTGWGQLLGELIPGVRIINRAMAGRSTKSFISEGRLVEVEKEIQPGDLLLIQFTHNDNNPLVWRHTDANTSFMANLEIFADTARVHGVGKLSDVIGAPIPIRCWREGELVDLHGEYPAAIRRLAVKKGALLIDVLEEGLTALRALGEEATRILYMNVEAGQYPAFPNGSKDDVHTQRAGAALYASIVAEQLKARGLV